MPIPLLLVLAKLTTRRGESKVWSRGGAAAAHDRRALTGQVGNASHHTRAPRPGALVKSFYKKNVIFPDFRHVHPYNFHLLPANHNAGPNALIPHHYAPQAYHKVDNDRYSLF